MQRSVQHLNNEIYKITITASTDQERRLLEKPINDITTIVFEHFDEAIKERLGEGATIESVVNDSGLPYEIIALVAIRNN